MQTVTVLGPNLADQSHGQVVVHAAGCKDIAKVRGAFGGRPDQDTTEYASKREIVEDIYPPEQFEWDGPDDVMMWGDVHIYPCVTLPKEA